MRSMATGLEAYLIDSQAYPTTVPLELYLAPAERKALRKMGGGNLSVPAGLTTPIAYLTVLFPDPYSVKDAPFAYFADSKGWILVSPGPDGRYDIVPERDYRGDDQQPSPALVAKAYDPTNGTNSPGDIFRTKQDTEVKGAKWDTTSSTLASSAVDNSALTTATAP